MLGLGTAPVDSDALQTCIGMLDCAFLITGLGLVSSPEGDLQLPLHEFWTSAVVARLAKSSVLERRLLYRRLGSSVSRLCPGMFFSS